VIDVRDLRRATGFDPDLLDALLGEAQRRGLFLVEAGGRVRLAGRDAQVDAGTSALLEPVRAALKSARYQPPAPAELAASLGARPDRMQAVFELLVDRGEVRLVARDFFLTAELHEAARAAIVENCTRNGSLDIPSLRDLLGTTRKFAVPIGEYLDRIGLTCREGDARRLNDPLPARSGR